MILQPRVFTSWLPQIRCDHRRCLVVVPVGELRLALVPASVKAAQWRLLDIFDRLAPSPQRRQSLLTFNVLSICLLGEATVGGVAKER